MTFEENREFSADTHSLVAPLAEHYVAVVLDYWQIFQGEGSTRPGPFLTRYGLRGIDTAGQYVIQPSGEIVAGPRSWKTGRGYTSEELYRLAARFPTEPDRRAALKLSWLMVDPEYYRVDLGTGGTNPALQARYCSAEGALTSARKVRRPLVRVDGPALKRLEEDQEFLRRHARQFWWQRGDPEKPARLVVLNSHDTPPGQASSELTGACSPGRVPVVLKAIDLAGGVDLKSISPALDEAWRRYMAGRPSNAVNLSFRKEEIPIFEATDATIRRLAKEGNLLAPGGRKLYR